MNTEPKEIKNNIVKSNFQSRALLIPNLITSVGIFCGFLAILSTLKQNYLQAAMALGLAFFLDGLDGRVARKLNAVSPYGRELDSLSDVIAFGVAPAVLLYSWAFKPLEIDFGVPIAFVFLVCGASRLARYNVIDSQKEIDEIKSPAVSKSLKGKSSNFEGLPIPAAAGSITSLVFFHPSPLEPGLQVSVYIIAGIVGAYSVLVSYLMVSNFKYPSPKYLRFSNINPNHALILISATVGLAWYNGRIVFAVGFFLYAISGPIFHFYNKKKQNDRESEEK